MAGVRGISCGIFDIVLNKMYFNTALADCNENKLQKSPAMTGIVAALQNRFVVRSNSESVKGSIYILMEPRDKQKDRGIIIEFKVFRPKKEKDLDGTCERALDQIEKKQYAQELM